MTFFGQGKQRPSILVRHTVREMSLVLAHLDQLRMLHAQSLRQLEEFRRDARDRLLNAGGRVLDSYLMKSDHADVRREARATLMELEAQRRRVVQEHERDLQNLERQLLLLLSRYEQLTFHNGSQ